ncbi:MAG: hypothetical protein R3A51_11295 [Nannocystaceae bacterium]|nr:hypothetical protein [Myxococcales bacterium]
MYEYRARVQRVIDGDTFDFDVDVGFYISLRMRVRLRGVNTPELRGDERERGLAAKEFVVEQLPVGSYALIRTAKIGKYGRYIADVRYLPGTPDASVEALQADGVDLAQALLKRKLAAPIDY